MADRPHRATAPRGTHPYAPDDVFSIFCPKKTRTRKTSKSTQKPLRERGMNAQERGETSDEEEEEDKTEDEGHFIPRQEIREGREALRGWVDEHELAARQLREAR